MKELAASNTRILYGGSVTADNISELIAVEDIGGASLKAYWFLGIIKNIAEKK